MYKNFFELQESPFTIAPDPRYLYMSEQHREALAHLLYGCKYEGGFVLLTGEVGTGKTTVCRCLLEQIPADTDVALILNPRLTVPELLASICQEFSIVVPPTDSVKVLVDAINHFLLDCNKMGRKAVLVIDEAQALSCEVLDQVRLLTNLETNTRKLLQIIMLGQPELLEKLARPEMRQLGQRITARYHLGPLSKPEVKEYVQHRWKVAGGKGDLLNDRQISRLYMLSKGIPRIINVICERILLGAYSQDERKISMAMFKQATQEVLGEVGPRRRIARKKISGLLWSALAAAAIFFIFFLSWRFLAEDTLPTGLLRPLAAVSTGSSPNSKAPSATKAPEGATKGLPTHSSDSATAITSDENSLANADVAPLSPETTGEVSSSSLASEVSMDWLLKGHTGQTRRRAFDDLLARWGLVFPDSESSACQFADESGLKCLYKRGSQNDLFVANRPAVLEMSSDDGVKFSAAIIQLDHQQGTLLVEGQARQAPADQIARHWSGRYIMVWKPPPGYEVSIKPGVEGPAVGWLAERLAEAGGQDPGSPAAVNADLVGEIKKFQIKTGLEPDGIAGVQTIMQLNSRTDKEVPLLHEVLP